jgi:hypothetical protein
MHGGLLARRFGWTQNLDSWLRYILPHNKWPPHGAVREAGNVSTQTQTRSRIQGQGCTGGTARGSNGSRDSRHGSGSIHTRFTLGRKRWFKPPRVFADHLGQNSNELTERKLAELYEKLGRVMVERDFLLRKSAL